MSEFGTLNLEAMAEEDARAEARLNEIHDMRTRPFDERDTGKDDDYTILTYLTDQMAVLLARMTRGDVEDIWYTIDGSVDKCMRKYSKGR